MNETTLTVLGNLTEDPELRQIKDGTINVVNFRIASTPRRYNKDTGLWEDGETLFLRVNCWRAMATNVAASLHKGDPVVVTGRLAHRSYTTETGEKRFSLELDAVALGHNLSRGISQWTKVSQLTPVPVAVPSAEPAVQAGPIKVESTRVAAVA